MKYGMSALVLCCVLALPPQLAAVPLDPPNYRQRALGEVRVSVLSVDAQCVVTGKVVIDVRDPRDLYGRGAPRGSLKGKTIRFAVNCRRSKTPLAGPISHWIGEIKKARYLHALLLSRDKTSGVYRTATPNSKVWVLASPWPRTQKGRFRLVVSPTKGRLGTTLKFSVLNVGSTLIMARRGTCWGGPFGFPSGVRIAGPWRLVSSSVYRPIPAPCAAGRLGRWSVLEPGASWQIDTLRVEKTALVATGTFRRFLIERREWRRGTYDVTATAYGAHLRAVFRIAKD